MVLALNGNVKKSQIAAGFAWGLLLGLIPIGNFFWIVLFLVSFFFSNNHASKIFGMAVIKLFSPLIAPEVDVFGWQVLHIEALQPLFTAMYNMPFVPFTKFNNTLVMGGLASGALLWLPVFFIFLALIPLYRKYVAAKIKESKILKKILKFPLFKIIEKALFSK
jgi:uncharacterized protein (TIGR03546 family)